MKSTTPSISIHVNQVLVLKYSLNIQQTFVEYRASTHSVRFDQPNRFLERQSLGHQFASLRIALRRGSREGRIHVEMVEIGDGHV